MTVRSGLRSRVERITQDPGYVAMRMAGRSITVRATVRAVLRWRHRHDVARAPVAPTDSVFADVDVDRLAATLARDGLTEPFHLPLDIVHEVSSFADASTLYADRDEMCGFAPGRLDQATAAAGKPILVAQYFNTMRECAAIERLSRDPVLEGVAAAYLGAPPRLVGANLWWTYPVDASDRDRDRHAHLFHRDVDDLGFVKFFFYLTDVAEGDGAHVCVAGSHRTHFAPTLRDRWRLRRYSDQEVVEAFGQHRVREICGPAGTGFAEDTFCLHKGLTPTQSPRLLLQFEFALRDYGLMHDRRSVDELRMLDDGAFAEQEDI